MDNLIECLLKFVLVANIGPDLFVSLATTARTVLAQNMNIPIILRSNPERIREFHQVAG